jgi:hypothetical protein
MKILFLGLTVLILALFISTGAGALSIDDSTNGATTYYGGTIHGSYNDVIGYDSDFSVTNLTATQAGGITTVDLTGPYFTTSYATGAFPYGNIGDLYISSTGWKVNSPADHARADTFDANEGWNYVVSFGQIKVYSLDFDKITWSGDEDYWSWYRTDQAYRGGYGSELPGVVSIEFNYTLGYLRFTFPDIGDVETMGFHWTMACGNDVVEGGGTPAPEPATMLLVGSGLLGLAGYGRKKFFKK